MSEYMLYKKNCEIRALIAKQASLQKTIKELTQTVQSLEQEIEVLNKRNKTLQIGSHDFHQQMSTQRNLALAKAEFYLP